MATQNWFRRMLTMYGSVGDGAVTEGKIGAAAVTNAKIGALAVAAANLAADAVTTTKIIDAAVTRGKLAVYAGAGATRRIRMQDWRLQTLLQLAAAADGTHLGLAAGTYGTNGPELIGSVANANSKTEKARMVLTLPPEYVAGSNLLMRFRCRVNGSAFVAQTIDLSVRKMDAEAGIGADLVVENAQAIPAAWGLVDFTVTGASLGAGDELDILLTLAVNDTGGTLNKNAEVGLVIMGCPETV